MSTSQTDIEMSANNSASQQNEPGKKATTETASLDIIFFDVESEAVQSLGASLRRTLPDPGMVEIIQAIPKCKAAWATLSSPAAADLLASTLRDEPTKWPKFMRSPIREPVGESLIHMILQGLPIENEEATNEAAKAIEAAIAGRLIGLYTNPAAIYAVVIGKQAAQQLASTALFPRGFKVQPKIAPISMERIYGPNFRQLLISAARRSNEGMPQTKQFQEALALTLRGRLQVSARGLAPAYDQASNAINFFTCVVDSAQEATKAIDLFRKATKDGTPLTVKWPNYHGDMTEFAISVTLYEPKSGRNDRPPMAQAPSAKPAKSGRFNTPKA